jgi:hypothetical protein
MVQMLIAQTFNRCGICNHWTLEEESDSFMVFRDGVEQKIMFGTCGLKSSQPDSECLCSCFEEKIEKIDDKEVQLFAKAVEEGNEALIYFKTTGDRSKFKQWHEKYGGKK